MYVKRIPMVAVLVVAAFALGCAGETAQEDTAADTAAGEMDEMGDTGEMGAMQEVADPIAALEGTHQMSSGNTATIANGRYTVVGTEGDTLAYGQMTASGDTVFINDEGGEMACLGQEGVYTVHMMGGELQMELVEDPCEGRRQDITGEGDGMDDGGTEGEAPPGA